MKVAIIGSRTIEGINLEEYIPDDIEISEIVSGGATGIDTLAKEYALSHEIKYTEFLPEYNKYSYTAPLQRNLEIVKYSDFVIAIWDGESRGTKHVIKSCECLDRPIKLHVLKEEKFINKIKSKFKK